ncbi:MAG: TlpA family protein disulfide reductase [Deltaproteobacteria bacterium]|nr:TlpA family protein disulfide reductase [Deltaproteobacteria bacterium]
MPPRTLHKIVGLITLVFMGACVTSKETSGALVEAPSADARSPLELRLPRLGGGMVDLHELRGRPVLLFFFATWSLRAQAEAAQIKRIAARYGQLAVVGIALDVKSKALVRAYVDFMGFSFPVAFVSPDDPRLLSAVGKTSRVPRSVLIDRGGRVIQDHRGGQTDFARLYRALDGL